MPKAGVILSQADKEKFRKAHDEVLQENKAFQAIVDQAIQGLSGTQRQKAWGEAVNKLVRENEAYKAAIQAKTGR
jgi:hypothetical protein